MFRVLLAYWMISDFFILAKIFVLYSFTSIVSFKKYISVLRKFILLINGINDLGNNSNIINKLFKELISFIICSIKSILYAGKLYLYEIKSLILLSLFSILFFLIIEL